MRSVIQRSNNVRQGEHLYNSEECKWKKEKSLQLLFTGLTEAEALHWLHVHSFVMTPSSYLPLPFAVDNLDFKGMYVDKTAECIRRTGYSLLPGALWSISLWSSWFLEKIIRFGVGKESDVDIFGSWEREECRLWSHTHTGQLYCACLESLTAYHCKNQSLPVSPTCPRMTR